MEEMIIECDVEATSVPTVTLVIFMPTVGSQEQIEGTDTDDGGTASIASLTFLLNACPGVNPLMEGSALP